MAPAGQEGRFGAPSPHPQEGGLPSPLEQAMPFDFSAGAMLPVDTQPIHGVPRHELVAHALRQLPAGLRDQVAEMEVTPAGSLVHMGMNFEQVAWRAVWRRAGLPVAAGNFPVWNGQIM
jgi:hypothetical protein